VSEGTLKTEEGRMWARRRRGFGGKKSEWFLSLLLT